MAHKLQRILKTVNIEVRHRSSNKLHSSLHTYKDRKRKNTQPGVYKIPCECGKVYIGETGRSFNTRFKEHKACQDTMESYQNHNSMYVYCLKLTNRPEITIKAHVFVQINRGKNLANYSWTASFWDLARQSVEQYVMNGPNPLFLEYYMYGVD